AVESDGKKPLEVKFESQGPVLTHLNEAVGFKCQINQDPFYVLKANAEIFQVHDGKEVVLNNGGKLGDGDPDHYYANIVPEKEDEDLHLILNILKVRDEDDGFLVCRVEHQVENERQEDKIEIIVQRPLESLKLKINDSVVDKSMSEKLELESGSYDISCIAEGSNPATTDVHIFFDGNKVNHKDPVSEPIKGGLRKYRTTIDSQLNLTAPNNGAFLECNAKSSLGDSLSVKFPIIVIMYEPEIVCNDTYASIGEIHHVLKCTVYHQQSKLKSFKYFIDNVEIEAGDQSSSYDDVTTKNISPDQTVVELRINKVVESHFAANFYLVLEHVDRHVTRHPVKLHKIEENHVEADVGGEGGNSSVFLFASLATVILCVTSATLSWI
ncbi:unnamed protein product, partial [Lymnaea stagnalis]